MNPALSVIFFTTLSGAGYGLLAWTALAALLRQPARPLLLSLLIGMVLVTIGLLSSLAHLGQPQRAWRALSQWRSSWLSREGVAALITYLPAVGLAAALLPAMLASDARLASTTLALPGVACACVLLVSALATVACTAMIYASLKPIPAWRHRLVLPVYLLFALVGGGWLWLAIHAFATPLPRALPVVATVATLVLGLCKWRYWRDIDNTALPLTRGDAIGLPQREVTLFERPITESNYVTREMVFALARKHARRLRMLAIGLLVLVPVLCAGIGAASPAIQPLLLALAALSALLGAFVERWLFFAQARHLVSLYY